MHRAFVFLGVHRSHQEIATGHEREFGQVIAGHRSQENSASGFSTTLSPMKLEPFALERFQSIWENSVAWNLAESGVHPLSVGELLGPVRRPGPTLADVRWDIHKPTARSICGARLPRCTPGATPDHIVVTNGGSEANCALMMRLVEPGDRVVYHDAELHAGERPRPRARGRARVVAAAAQRRRRPRTMDRRSRRARGTRDAGDSCRPRVQSEQPDRSATRCGSARRDLPDCGSVEPGSSATRIYRGAERVAEETRRPSGAATSARSCRPACRRPMVCLGCASDGSSRPWRSPQRSGASTITRRLRRAPSTIVSRGSRSRLPAAPGCSRARRSIIRANYPIVRDWISAHDGLDHAAPDAGAIVFVRYRHPVSSDALVVAPA